MRFWTRRDGLEQRLRTHHTARRDFVHDLAMRMVGRPSTHAGARSARFALVFAVLALFGLAAFGGFGYAASGGHLGILGPVHIVTKAVNGPNNGNGNGKSGNGKGNGNGANATSNGKGNGKGGGGGAGNGGGTTTTTSSTSGASQPANTNTQTSPGNSGNTPADDQYKPGCGKGDKNHDHTGPPGKHNGFPGKCPH
jgi:hypothetical protein